MLPSNLANAHVIIHKLDQPHRYDFALHCKCGFQHHGFTNQDTGKGGPEADMVASARSHLMNKHGVQGDKAESYIEVTPFAHVGGADHFMLSQLLAQHKEKETALQNEKETEAAKAPKAPEPKAEHEQKGTVVTPPSVPTQTAASTAVKKLTQR